MAHGDPADDEEPDLDVVAHRAAPGETSPDAVQEAGAGLPRASSSRKADAPAPVADPDFPIRRIT